MFNRLVTLMQCQYLVDSQVVSHQCLAMVQFVTVEINKSIGGGRACNVLLNKQDL